MTRGSAEQIDLINQIPTDVPQNDDVRLGSSNVALGLTDNQQNRLVRYIDENLGHPISVDDLAAQINKSASRLFRVFKVSFGVTPHAYILARRVNAAKKMMISTGEPLSRVAALCGLTDDAQLSKVFKRYVGVSPSDWRRLQGSREDATAGSATELSKTDICQSASSAHPGRAS